MGVGEEVVGDAALTRQGSPRRRGARVASSLPQTRGSGRNDSQVAVMMLGTHRNLERAEAEANPDQRVAAARQMASHAVGRDKIPDRRGHGVTLLPKTATSLRPKVVWMMRPGRVNGLPEVR